ncbi:MucR family transcriptional regulator [Labrys monachus]|uniref:Transcriptional regulator n=1 Tax=Labrys monachus TaxID=217067 RepID=A0ABU0FAJ8_9HYPH|nr:MucR family transcriptional regulator [Labrys monachus]MDQ0391647.1 putative transcriptional regulator [Labrys monachus]
MTDRLATITARIIVAYVSNNWMTSAGLTGLIDDVHSALHRLAKDAPSPSRTKPIPAVPIRGSVTPDFIVCLEDGLKYRSLVRHLSTKYNLTPKQYREKWGLPNNYPMVAPNFAVRRPAVGKKPHVRHHTESRAESRA